MRLLTNLMLRSLYQRESLRNIDEGVTFSLKNRLREVSVTGISRLALDSRPADLARLTVTLPGGVRRLALGITPNHPLVLPLGGLVHLCLEEECLEPGRHHIELAFDCPPLGQLSLKVEDQLQMEERIFQGLPRDEQDDYSASAIARRLDFVRKNCPGRLEHVTQPSFDPHLARGNVEHFIGVAQVPIGVAGPLLVHGEHAQGEFYVPLATTEGTLVASYNRGMKLLRKCGGVTCTVVGDQMQRAPVFVFANARGGRRFADWVVEHLDEIRAVAESTSSVARLKHIDYYLSNRFAYLRFNFLTGDAAGQNMVGRATFAACNWILENYEPEQIERFFLESNFATDKKASMINIMRTRGKRVTAEATISRQDLLDIMGVDSKVLAYHHGVANVGSFLAGVNNNGLHSANAITAMFIATGQDVANVAESSAAIIYAELTEGDDLYFSITLPSLIVATHGGGTGLPTQRECLEMLGCHGHGKVHKLAEIVAATVLAGELSLASAISSLDWVPSHEALGRNR
jgi:hydroxymethylglutaryl-CoA reductase (NADPH)